MKKLFNAFLFLIVMLPLVEASARITSPVELTFNLYWDDTSISHGEPTKNPPEAPVAYLDGNTLFLSGLHPDYTVELVDNSGLVYQTSLSSSLSQVEFPSTFCGAYELRLVTGYCYFSTIIYL